MRMTTQPMQLSAQRALRVLKALPTPSCGGVTQADLIQSLAMSLHQVNDALAVLLAENTAQRLESGRYAITSEGAQLRGDTHVIR
jgi:hypothetical protein